MLYILRRYTNRRHFIIIHSSQLTSYKQDTTLIGEEICCQRKHEKPRVIEKCHDNGGKYLMTSTQCDGCESERRESHTRVCK